METKELLLKTLHSGFEHDSSDEQMTGIIQALILYIDELQNKSEFLINLRDFIEQDINDEFK